MKITYESTDEFANAIIACNEIASKGKCPFCPLKDGCDKEHPVVKNAEIKKP